MAIADALLTGTPYEVVLKEYALRYLDAGYGYLFMSWENSNSYAPLDAMQSYGSGASMRIPPVAYWFNSMEAISSATDASAITTHRTGEGVCFCRENSSNGL
ncbi:ADP-ribosylglycohydrolase family protein [Geofilum rubicundum]|uniref:ADP-ribosylglycohydrolase family protein n=1 Tax=Geofilum rubicundum TaxID=472113 RepID=UPI0012F8DCB0|nr:ADP-ribosylglycohydrolase family protein [Geofilum rubicundum]